MRRPPLVTDGRGRARELLWGTATERGTALVLVPALFLVVLCLGAVAVDLSLLHAAHRGAHRVASSAADDAAAMLDERQLQLDGTLRLDVERATRTAAAHIRTAQLAGSLVDVEILVGETTVDVTLTVDVRHVVLPALADGDGHTRIQVRARGRMLR